MPKRTMPSSERPAVALHKRPLDGSLKDQHRAGGSSLNGLLLVLKLCFSGFLIDLEQSELRHLQGVSDQYMLRRGKRMGSHSLCWRGQNHSSYTTPPGHILWFPCRWHKLPQGWWLRWTHFWTPIILKDLLGAHTPHPSTLTRVVRGSDPRLAAPVVKRAAPAGQWPT